MNIRQYRAALKQKLDAEAARVAEEALRISNEYTPVRSGFLRSRNQLRRDQSGWVLFNDADYAIWRYFGTSKITGVRWFRIALDAIRSRR